MQLMELSSREDLDVQIHGDEKVTSPERRWQLAGSGPESYERYQVPSLFEPLARLFLGRVPLQSGNSVLDVACGTGVVARLAAPIVGIRGRVTALDLNQGMIDIGRRQKRSTGAPIEWRRGDAANLPFDDGTFDIVLCQQGLQFMPDPVRALEEMRRVLVPGGWLAFSVWRTMEHSPCNLACYDALRRHCGESVANKLLAPFVLGEADHLHDIMAEAGFDDVALRQAEIIRHMLPPREAIPGHLASTPVAEDFSAIDRALRDRIIDEIGAALSPYRSEDGMKIPQGTHMALARK